MYSLYSKYTNTHSDYTGTFLCKFTPLPVLNLLVNSSEFFYFNDTTFVFNVFILSVILIVSKV